MRQGKVTQAVLDRSILRQLGKRREDVLAGPAIGQGFAAVKTQEDAVALTCAPAVLYRKEMAALTLHRAWNSIWAAGAVPAGAMVSLLLPEEEEEQQLRELMRRIEQTAADCGMEILGGHTEVTAAVKAPILTVTGVGKGDPERLSHPSKLQPGQELVVTKGIGIGATAYLAMEREQELLMQFSPAFLHTAVEFRTWYSVEREAEIARREGACAMQDISEGGIFGSLWEMAESSGVGLEISLKAVPIRQETVEICEYFGLNPYQMLSTGALLIGTRDGASLVRTLEREGIASAVIGCTTSGHDRIIRNGEEIRYLDKPQMEELYRVMADRA